MSAYFITASGTDIGKTYVTAGLIRHLRDAGKEVEVLKPVVSGYTREAAAASDPGMLLSAMGLPVSDANIRMISRWRFAPALSPDMAAAREDRTIPFDTLVDICHYAILERRGTMLIEGVGGVMVPLDRRHTVLDWIAVLDIPAIVVTGSYLGSISHALTALNALANRGVEVAALVLNESAESTVDLEETAASLAHFTGDIPIVTIRRGQSDFSALAASLDPLSVAPSQE